MGRIQPYLPPQFGKLPALQGQGKQSCQKSGSELDPDALEKLKTNSFKRVMAHESAHQAAAPQFSGSIHIDYDSNGIAVGGHVPISIPGLNPAKPEESLSAAKTVFGAAVAPSADASGQDMAVAAQAMALMGQAKVLIDQKNIKPPQQV